MLKELFISCCIGFVCCTLGAANNSTLKLPPENMVNINNKGIININGIRIFVANWAANSSYTNQNRALKPKPWSKNNSTFTLDGTYTAGDGFKMDFTETVSSQDKKNCYAVKYAFTGTKNKLMGSFALCISLPSQQFKGKSISINGKKVLLPVAYRKKVPFSGTNIKTLSLPCDNGDLNIKGNFKLRISDDRKNNDKLPLNIFIAFDKDKTANFLSMELSYRLSSIIPVDISPKANMGFRDEKAEDQKGGWTDQGSSNDLPMDLKGPHSFNNVDMYIIDPAKNRGKSCLVFSGPARSYFPETAEINIDNSKITSPAKTIYLLHAIAWAPPKDTQIGEIEVSYKDGTKQNIKVINGRDVSNWHRPLSQTNGKVVWKKNNSRTEVGLFLSKFKLANKVPAKIIFRSTGKAVWMLAAVSVGDDVLWQTEQESIVTANKNWRPFEQKLDINDGSILDFSFLSHRPAGKYGQVINKNGSLEFTGKPGSPVRFYGCNLTLDAAYLNKATSEKVAERLRKTGYNAVRIANYDHFLMGKLQNRTPGAVKSTIFNKEQLDKLDYLFYCLKKNGIYINIDVYMFRRLKAGELPEIPESIRHSFKGLVPILKSASDNWKEFAKNLLGHKNPYTGMTWAEDPALFGVCLMNEAEIYATWRSRPYIKKYYEQAFKVWCRNKNINLNSKKRAAEKNRLMVEFLNEIENKMIVSLTAYLRQIGYKGLVTDANFQTKLCQALIRENVDYVDQHDYWSHKYLKSLYYLRNNHSIIDYCAAVPRLIMTARILGKPFMVTEFNFDPPNNFRAEGGPVMAAYSALQGWGAIFRYAYSHTVKKLLAPHRIEHIDVACDPLSFFSEKIGILLYRRNDVKEAGTAIPYAYNRNVLKLEGILSPKKAGIPENYSYLGLYSKIGLVKVEPGQKLPSEYSCGFTNKNFGIKADERLLITDLSNTKFVNTLADRRIIKPGHIDIKKKFFLSETGQICLNGANGSFKVVTPKSECLILKAGKALKGKNIQVKDPKTRSVVFVSAMDGKDLTDSGRILILFLTDLQNSKLKTILRDSNLYVKDWGSLPHLIRSGQVQVSILNNAANASWDLWAVDMSGKRVVKIAAKVQNGKIILDLKNLVKQKTYMAFELVKADNSGK